MAMTPGKALAHGVYGFNDPQTIGMADAQVALSMLSGVASTTQVSSNILYVDPASTGGTEDLLLPPEAQCPGLMLIIVNTADAAEDIVVKEDGDATVIATIGQGEQATCVCDGTTWRGSTASASSDLATVAGVGITGTADNFASGVQRIGSLFKTTIVIDIDGLNGGGTIGDIIGADGAGAAHLGQITTAKNGTIFAGSLQCLELPTGSDPDIDLYSAVEATGIEDSAIGDLTETLLLNSGDLVSGTTLALTAFPAADEYLYLTNGTVTAGTYTAGIIVIELWGK